MVSMTMPLLMRMAERKWGSPTSLGSSFDDVAEDGGGDLDRVLHRGHDRWDLHDEGAELREPLDETLPEVGA